MWRHGVVVARYIRKEGSTLLCSFLIKCQLTLGRTQATMHDWVGMNGWNMCEEYILFTTIHEWRNNQILIGRAWKIFTLTLEIARLVTLLLTEPNQPCYLDNFLPANSFSSFMQGKVDNSVLCTYKCWFNNLVKILGQTYLVNKCSSLGRID